MGERLLDFNAESDNRYRDSWGSLLNYLNQDKIVINGEEISPDQIFKIQMSQKEEEILKMKPEEAKEFITKLLE